MLSLPQIKALVADVLRSGKVGATISAETASALREIHSHLAAAENGPTSEAINHLVAARECLRALLEDNGHHIGGRARRTEAAGVDRDRGHNQASADRLSNRFLLGKGFMR